MLLRAPSQVKSLEQSTGHLVSPSLGTAVARALRARDRHRAGAKACRCTPRGGALDVEFGIAYGRASTRARGDERLSDSQKHESKGGGKGKRQPGSGDGSKKGSKPRSADVGRALRSVYDDTLRESVPDDFLDLLGKLS